MSPDGSQYPFGLGFSPKDREYSGREVVMKNNSCAPKKNTNLSTGVYVIVLIISRFTCLFERSRELECISTALDVTKAYIHETNSL